MQSFERKTVNRILLILFAVMMISATVHIIYTVSFNRKLHTTDDPTEESSFTMSGRGGATSSWIKHDYDLYGERVDLTAQTVDGTFHNNSKYDISSWNLTVIIEEDCFINNGWCGVWEIHQNVGTHRETVQTLDLRNYNLDDVKLEYLYDGDLLIPLKKGDFVYYFPSAQDRELSIKSGAEITIGSIFYYRNDLNIPNYSVEFYYYKSLFQGVGYFITAILLFVWLIILFMSVVSGYTYKRAWEEMETQRKIERAEAENRAKSAFLANMSHEIRTPINTVLGLDTMILRESREENTRAYARKIKSAGQMLLSLINGILDSSKLEAGKMELVPAEYSLKQMVFDVRTITKAIVDARNLEYIISVDENIPDKLYGDDVRIKQIMINLITNAAKYTEKGSVTLSVSGREEESVFHLNVAVKDTGVGIKEEDLVKLSERFTRLDEMRNRNIEGTGLGLSLVKGLLELMDSNLKIESIYGEGSTFSFDIVQDVADCTPVGDIDFENMDTDDSDYYAVSFKAPDAKVLVVDDNPMNLSVFENLLKETEVKIDKAGSGKEALALTLRNNYDVIFMDAMMPEMDGVECFGKIKEQSGGKNNETPVLILTANAVQGAKEEYLAEGFADFLAKPIEPGKLEEKLCLNIPKEKIVKAAEEFEVKKSDETSEKLPEIEGVDIAYAIAHVGDAKSTLNVMKQFTAVAQSDADELSGYYEALKNDASNEDALKAYRIKVHSMKTSAGLFGALWVYGVAAFLEMAARDGNVERIIDVTPHFFDFWHKLDEHLKDYFASQQKTCESSEGKPDIREAADLIHQLATSIGAYDIKSADALIEKLESYALSADKTPVFDKLKLAVSQLDAETAKILCDELVK